MMLEGMVVRNLTYYLLDRTYLAYCIKSQIKRTTNAVYFHKYSLMPLHMFQLYQAIISILVEIQCLCWFFNVWLYIRMHGEYNVKLWPTVVYQFEYTNTYICLFCRIYFLRRKVSYCDYLVACICVSHFRFWSNWPILTKLGMGIIRGFQIMMLRICL
jgi:hypothetical protein